MSLRNVLKMNKIVLDNKKVVSKTNDNISLTYEESKNDLNIPYVHIKTNEPDELFLDLSFNKAKLIVDVDVNCDLNLFIFSQNSDAKIKYHFNINNESVLNVFKYNKVKHINEMVVIDLNKENSKVNYLFKSISTKLENYDYIINHHFKNTYSNIINNGVNKNGSMNIQISGYVPKNITGCVCNQSNRIINLTNNKCEIRPNLYIDCNDVDANHSALIGKFSDDEMFYLNSRGITDEIATNLLLKGFLLNGIENIQLLNEITKDIDAYWR